MRVASELPNVASSRNASHSSAGSLGLPDTSPGSQPPSAGHGSYKNHIRHKQITTRPWTWANNSQTHFATPSLFFKYSKAFSAFSNTFMAATMSAEAVGMRIKHNYTYFSTRNTLNTVAEKANKRKENQFVLTLHFRSEILIRTGLALDLFRFIINFVGLYQYFN